MGEFTPGPWGDERKTVIVRGLTWIAHAHYPSEEGLANARLIAAAPELLEALDDVLRYHEGKGEYNFSGLSSEERANASFDAWQGILVGIKAAITKATIP